MTPPTEADLGRIVAERHIRDVHGEIQYPVRERRARNQQHRHHALLRGERRDDRPENERFGNRSRKIVGKRHILKVEGIGLCEPRYNAQLLNTDQHQSIPTNQKRPHDVHALHGNEPNPEGDTSCGRLGSKRHAIVPDKHAVGSTLARQRTGARGPTAHARIVTGCEATRRWCIATADAEQDRSGSRGSG